MLSLRVLTAERPPTFPPLIYRALGSLSTPCAPGIRSKMLNVHRGFLGRYCNAFCEPTNKDPWVPEMDSHQCLVSP